MVVVAVRQRPHHGHLVHLSRQARHLVADADSRHNGVDPSDLADDVIDKVREYLSAGVRLVWVVYPLAREVHAFLPGVRENRVFFESDDLDTGEILPGFHTSVASRFPPIEQPPAQ